MKVLVTGGREYDNVDALWSELDWWHERCGITCLIQGGASGADRIAAGWAVSSEVDCICVEADWGKHKKAAGPIRNQRMLDEHKPDLVLACPGNRGTADMVRRAKKAGVRVIDVQATPRNEDKPYDEAGGEAGWSKSQAKRIAIQREAAKKEDDHGR